MHPSAYLDMASLEAGHWWYQGRRQILDAMITTLNLPAGATILEVGCGTGGNLAMLSRHGLVTAVEMDDAARTLAQQKHKATINIHAGWMPDNLPELHQKFDLICLFDVLEHITADVASLERLRGLLSPNGRIVLTVPAYQWLWSRHDEYHHHQRRYTAKTLAHTIRQAGLRPQRLSYFNTLLFPMAATVRLLEKLLGKQSGMAASMPSRAVNRLLSLLLASESRWLKIMNLAFGLSLIAVVRPQDRPQGRN